ncbi:MAG: hypothetical protein MUF71_18140 [Candidatus Kapabacteria bacterium]|jgi:hypothetical protein|nr:hypothetical protein [Candidatus Kapabacteria bacterium]
METNSPQNKEQSVLRWSAKSAEDIQMNVKQIELAEELVKTLQASYPQVEHLGYKRDPADKQIIWIIVEAPIADEDEDMEFWRVSSDLTNKITNTYGHDFFVVAYNPLIEMPLYSARQAA